MGKRIKYKYMKLQKYVAEANIDGMYDLLKFNELTEQYEVIVPGLPRELTIDLALELNSLIFVEDKTSKLIDKYRDLALSTDNQKRNAAREFFINYSSQRDLCCKYLSDLFDKDRQ